MQLRAAVLAALSICVAPAWAQQETAQEAGPTEKILVVGQRPGPGLWKVSKDDHVLWVFGTYSPLPLKMEWRSQEVEAIIGQSQELLSAPGMGLSVGWMDTLNIVTALPSLVGARKNVNGESLQEVVPPDVYVRWLPLKAKYLGDDSGVDSMRPMFAAEKLFDKALAQSGLGNDRAVAKRIEDIARQHKLKMTATGFSIPLENPRGALKDFKKSALDDIPCFTKTVDRLETDLDGMRLRANAWAIGDVAKMRALVYPNQAEACRQAMTSSGWMKGLKGAENLEAKGKATWLAAAEHSLATNKSTFALLPVAQAMNQGGYLDALREKGYVVEQPE
ncbi:MAG: TraB/GumN family protein [Massilia sp.]